MHSRGPGCIWSVFKSQVHEGHFQIFREALQSNVTRLLCKLRIQSSPMAPYHSRLINILHPKDQWSQQILRVREVKHRRDGHKLRLDGITLGIANFALRIKRIYDVHAETTTRRSVERYLNFSARRKSPDLGGLAVRKARNPAVNRI